MNFQTTSGFAALGVPDELAAALSKRGIDQPFPIQALTIPDALAGRDVCGKAKTGSGKTLAFGLPVLTNLTKAEVRKPTALALVPTRELAVQVCDELDPLAQAVGRRVTAIYGGAKIEAQRDRLNEGVDFVVATPGRLIDLLQQGDLTLDDVEVVIVDEADRMADMGFLPQVEWVLRHIKRHHQTLLFSATLDGVVDALIKRYQHDPAMHEVESETVTVDEMVHHVFKVHQMDKTKVAAVIAQNVGRTIMFTRTKFGADRLARDLKAEGVRAAAIHGDLRQNHREAALADFGSGKLSVMVATDVAARGLHIDEVDVVIHFDPPEDHKTYLHRSGRTARAGESGIVVSLMLWDQELEMKRLLKRVGLDLPLIELFSNDKRLTDLAAWDKTA